MSKPLYTVGDKVEVNKTFTMQKNVAGCEGEIQKVFHTSPIFYDVLINDVSGIGSMLIAFKESELDYITQFGNISIQNILPDAWMTNGSQTVRIPVTGHYNISANILKQQPTQHSCLFKTYTGLQYSEDYCECGVTKNKRGIYE